MANNKLPPKCRAKIFSLADQEAAALTALNSNQRQIAELAKSHDIVSDDERKREIREESNRRQTVQETQRERHRALADLNGKLRRFLDTLPADAIVDDAKPVKAKLGGKSHLIAVADLRVQIVNLIGERSRVERAALPTDEIKAQVKKWITERSLRTRPTIEATHDRFVVKFKAYVEDAYVPTLDIASMLAWFDPEHMEEKLMALIDEMPKPKLAMTPAEKTARLAEIKTELADAERLECALIDDAQDHGIIIDHRPNVDIKSLLGIVVTKKKARAA